MWHFYSTHSTTVGIALLRSEFTEKDATLLLRFFGSIPSRAELRNSRWSLLDSFPTAYTLNPVIETLTEPPKGRSIIRADASQNIEFARIHLLEFMQDYLESAHACGFWPTPPDLIMFNSDSWFYFFLYTERQTHLFSSHSFTGINQWLDNLERKQRKT